MLDITVYFGGMVWHVHSHIVRRMVLDVWCKFGAGTITLSEIIGRGR